MSFREELGIRSRFGIPTEYAGAQFRSRLEAKWAAFFDLLKWPWQYEPFDLGGYIPDFLITFPTGRKWLVEVKPACTWEELTECSEEMRTFVSPNKPPVFEGYKLPGFEGDVVIVGSGVLKVPTETTSEPSAVVGIYPFGSFGNGEADCTVFYCDLCEGLSLVSNSGGWGCNRCGGIEGDPHGHKHWWYGMFPDPREIETMFNKAGAITQWRGKHK